MKALLVAAALFTLAHEHAQYDEKTLKWFRGLHNYKGNLCCDGKDSVTPNGWRLGSESYEVQIRPGGPWLPVPNDSIVKEPNLLNETHVWPRYDEATGITTIVCFMPGASG